MESSASDLISDQFPVGLRVLVVDDDTTCLRILEQMLRKCSYYVTTCCEATVALNILRERKGCFDVVISDVHMPDMDGFKLLEHVGLEMDLPVIMMSADGRTSAVMRGIKHGACDYLIKPVRLEELKNIWQHVVRKKWSGSRDVEQSGSVEEHDRHKRGGEDNIEYSSSANEGTDGSWKPHKKRKDAKEEEEEGDLDNDDPSSSKKPRVVWSVELHQQFVNAVNQLGIDKAVPKRILELMNVPGITRENVASHLQKFRLYLKRLSGVAQQQSGISNMYYGAGESNSKLASLSGLDIQALAASGQIPPQTLAALHAEVFGRPTSSIVLPVEHAIAYGQPIGKGQPLVSKHAPQSSTRVDDISSGYGSWIPNNNLGAVNSTGNQGGLNIKNHMLRQILPHQQSVVAESSHAINVQPSCLVAPSQPASSFRPGNISVPFNQGSTGITSSFLSSQSQSNRVSVGTGQVVGVDYKNSNVSVVDGFSISSSMSSCSGRSDSGSSWQVRQNSPNGASTNLWGVHGASYTPTKRGDLSPNQAPARNHLGFVGKGTSLPSRFAIDDFESDLSNNGNGFGDNNEGVGVKQEVSLDFIDNAKSWHGTNATIFS